MYTYVVNRLMLIDVEAYFTTAFGGTLRKYQYFLKHGYGTYQVQFVVS